MRSVKPCGCKHDGRQWLLMCAPHQSEFTERHLRAQKEKNTAELVGWYSAGHDTADQSKPE